MGFDTKLGFSDASFTGAHCTKIGNCPRERSSLHMVEPDISTSER